MKLLTLYIPHALFFFAIYAIGFQKSINDTFMNGDISLFFQKHRQLVLIRPGVLPQVFENILFCCNVEGRRTVFTNDMWFEEGFIFLYIVFLIVYRFC